MNNNELGTQLVSDSSGRANPPHSEKHRASPGAGDILFILFRHKKLILILSALGVLASVCIYLKRPTVYESQAKLLIDYVVSRSSIESDDSEMVNGGRSSSMKSAINAELEILTSSDLALRVVNDIGAEKILPDEKDPSSVIAAAKIFHHLRVQNARDSQVIKIGYTDTDPSRAVEVLSNFVNQYFRMHVEIRRSVDIDKARALLDGVLGDDKKKETEIGKILGDLPGNSIEGEMASTIAKLNKAEEKLLETRAELVRLQSLLGAMEEHAAAGAGDSTVPSPNSGLPGSREIEAYYLLSAELTQLRTSGIAIRQKYRANTTEVKSNQTAVARLSAQKVEMEKDYPSLRTQSAPGSNGPVGPAGPTLQSGLAGLVAAVSALQATETFLLEELETQTARYEELALKAPKLATLERERGELLAESARLKKLIKMEETDQELVGVSADSSKIPDLENIDVIQRPSIARVATSKMTTLLMLGFGGGGIAGGIAIALFIGLILDRSVKRPEEIESGMRLPLMLSIPYLKSKGEKGAGKQGGERELSLTPSPWDEDHFIRPFSDAIRDRIECQFEFDGLTHKPKLVGLTAFSIDAGTSTLASSLAASLSETVEGKVLFVDLSGGEDSADVRVDAGPDTELELAGLSGDEIGLHEQTDKLSVATISGRGRRQIMPRKLHQLLPQFRSSDFEYVIFDLPPVGPTSPTVAMAGFMDKILLVVDAGKTSRDVIKRCYDELVGTKADVSNVLNKTRESLPSWLQG